MGNKIIPYLEKIVSLLIKDTEYKVFGTIADGFVIVNVNIWFPMYPDNGYTYTMAEIYDWSINPLWEHIGTDDIEYFENYYGLTRDETKIVLGMYLGKFTPIVYSEMKKYENKLLNDR